MSDKNVTVGLDIEAGTKGAEKIIDLAKIIKEAGVATENLADEGKELGKSFADLSHQQNLITHFSEIEEKLKKSQAALNKELDETVAASRRADSHTVINGND